MNNNKYVTFCTTVPLSVISIVTASYADYDLSVQKSEWQTYKEYEYREPCQNYRKPPVGLVREGCHLDRPIPFIGNQETVRDSNVLNYYEINFDFDQTTIDAASVLVLDQVAREIRAYHPSEVTISGFTDRAGTTSYNMGLSQRRAQNVSQALTERDVLNRVTNQIGYGEDHLAIETDDGVSLRNNRRVVIEFKK